MERDVRWRAARRWWASARGTVVVAAALLGCTPEVEADGPRFLVDLTGGFWASPFPSLARLGAGGFVDLSEMPGVEDVTLLTRAAALIDGVEAGFGVTTPILFPVDRSLVGMSVPSALDTLDVQAPVGLVDVDPRSPERGRRFPLRVFVRDGVSPVDPAHGLVLLPAQGAPLREGTRYAAYVTRGLIDGRGDAAGSSPAWEALISGRAAGGIDATDARAWQAAAAELATSGVVAEEIAALTVFDTSRPTDTLAELAPIARAEGLRWSSPLAWAESYDGFCTYEGRVSAPVYQRGEPPYLAEGGGIGAEVVRREDARIWLTVPRGATSARLPLVVFIRTGGGGDRPLIDRSVHTIAHGPDTPGEGYAADFAEAGYAAVQIDGPLGGLRNTTGGDEQFLVFNVANPEALRDNLRQSALELALLPGLLADLVVDGSACEGGPELRLDTDGIALWGHSMGASIAPLVVPVEPRYDTLLLSGAGGSFLENVLHKEAPLAVRPLIAGLLREDAELLDEGHPGLGLLQWAGEAADVPPSARAAADRALHVLMVQGVVDHYILPPIANVASMSLGLDLVGPPVDRVLLPELESAVDALALVGRGEITAPARANVGAGPSASTRVVVQRAEDGVEDGHEIAYQSEEVRALVRTFLTGRLAGAPEVR